MSTREVYLDYAAATPMAGFVFEAMRPYFASAFYNPSSPYAPAVAVRRDYEAAKQAIAETIGAKGDELVMTAGATESISLAFRATAGHVVTASIEHPAVLEAAKSRPHTLVAPNEKGRVLPEQIERAITPETTFISISLANNELGTIQPIRAIAQLVEQIRQQRKTQPDAAPLLLHCDASQGFDQLDVHTSRLGIDLLTLNAGKLYGPKQVGLLWAKRSVRLEPQIKGGGQERGLRSGTENVAGVIGFAAAAQRARQKQPATAEHLAALRDDAQARLVRAFPSAEVLGDKKHRLPGHLSIAFPGIDAERIIFLLEKAGVYVATGSACSANKHTASHVLKAINLPDELINGSLRLTLGRDTTGDDIKYATGQIIQALESEYQRMEASA